MTPSEDERARVVTGLVSAVAALQAGERHAAEDLAIMRRDLRETERRIIDEVNKVDAHCAQRFKDAAAEFKADHASKRGVTVAWIGGACLLIASIINSVAALTGGGGP